MSLRKREIVPAVDAVCGCCRKERKVVCRPSAIPALCKPCAQTLRRMAEFARHPAEHEQTSQALAADPN